jgi:hypothetical protein
MTNGVSRKSTEKNHARNFTAATPGVTMTASQTMADRRHGPDNPGNTGGLIRVVRLTERHPRQPRVTENRRPEHPRPSGTTKDINGKTAMRTHVTGIEKETTGEAMSITMITRIHEKDSASRMIATSTTGD